jgi:hypothetical protein
MILVGDLPVKVAEDFAAMGARIRGVCLGVQHFNRKRTIRTLGGGLPLACSGCKHFFGRFEDSLKKCTSISTDRNGGKV